MNIQLLGPVLVTVDGRVLDVGPPQRCAVLAALAVDAGRLVTTETLIERVWGGNPSTLARRALHAHIARLRRLLEADPPEADPPEADPPEADPPEELAVAIRSRSGGYVLEVEPDRVDVLAFRRLLARADEPGRDRGSRVELLRAAMGLWHGEPLAGLSGLWPDRTREGWHRSYLQAAPRWAAAELEVGNCAAVVERMSELIQEHPLDEHVAAVLMRALHRVGNQAAALRVFAVIRARLVDELGAEPGAALRRIHGEILRGEEERTQPDTGRTDSRRRVTWPHQVGVPAPRADGFQRRVLADEAAAVPGTDGAGPAALVLSGLGGVGKTQLAAEIARNLWAAGDLDLLIWVSAVSRDAVVSNYARACDDLALGPRSEPPGQAAARLLAWLATTGRRWLVVLDDVARPADVHDLWPPRHRTGRTVVTTRRRDAALLAGRTLVDVGVFEPGEAAAYLRRKLPDRLGDDIAGVVADLGALPLALGHAAAYMIDQDLACSGYRARFDGGRRRLTQLFPDRESLFDGTAGTVATTWTISVDAADALTPAGLARPLLEIAAMLDPNGIPDTLFTSAACRRHIERRLLSRRLPSRRLLSGTVPGPHLDDDTLRDGLRCLHRFHLIAHAGGLVRVHALVQRAVRECLDDGYARDVARTAADALVEIWPTLDNHTGQLLRANADAVARHGDAALWPPGAHPAGAHPLLARTVESLGAAAQLPEAVARCRGYSERAAEVFGRDHPDTFRLLNLLCGWIGDADQPAEAVTRLEKLAPGAVAALGPEHPVTLDIRHNLGYQRGLAGDPRAAAADLAAVVSDRIRVLGPDHPTVMGCRAQLAYWRAKAGDPALALSDLEELLPRAVRILGPDHHDILEIRGCLGQCRGYCGDIAGAIADLTALLADARRITGTRPRAIAVHSHNLAVWRWKGGEPQEAARLLREVLVERLDLFGPDHRDTLVTRHALAAIGAEAGDHAAPGVPEGVLADVLADFSRVLGVDHQHTLYVRRDLACLRGRLGDPARAATELREVCHTQERLLGAGHADTLATREAYLYWRDAPGTCPRPALGLP